jgi:hypothetical protein
MLMSFELTLDLNRPSQPALSDLLWKIPNSALCASAREVGQAGLRRLRSSVSAKLISNGRGTRRLLPSPFADGRHEREQASQRFAHRRRLVTYEPMPPDATKIATDQSLVHPFAVAVSPTHPQNVHGVRKP